MKQNNKKAVIYCRVASTTQNDRSKSIAGQEEICRQYAKLKGYDVTKVFTDYTSGNNPKRKGFEQMIKTIVGKNVDIVCVTALDRISRNTEQAQNFLALLKKHRVELACTYSPICVLAETMFSAYSQYEREARRQRIIAGIARKKSLLRSGASTKI